MYRNSDRTKTQCTRWRGCLSLLDCIKQVEDRGIHICTYNTTPTYLLEPQALVVFTYYSINTVIILGYKNQVPVIRTWHVTS